MQSRRDAGITALVEGFFAMAWFGRSQEGPPDRLVVAVGALIAGLASDVLPSAVTGIGAGAPLAGSGIAALVRALRRPAPAA